MRVDRAVLDAARQDHLPIRVDHVAVNDRHSVALELTPFRVVSPDTRFVIGRPDGRDAVLEYDWRRVTLLRGTVVGHPGSSAYVALIEGRSTGHIDLGVGQPRYRVSSTDFDGRPLPAGEISVFRASGMQGGPAPGVAHCGVDDTHFDTDDKIDNRPTRAALGTMPSTVGLKHLELAIETDYELFQLFDDATAAMDYVISMYGEVSVVYQRDVDTWIEITWVRIWDQPDDLFNGPDPLAELRPYWNNNDPGVQRDTLQFFSGRRDFPYGGAAYLSSLCGPFGYGVVGYAAGFFPDPMIPDAYTWDIEVTAHELGHTCGAPHTHDIGIDTCQNPVTIPQRGSIMAYCSQTWSGMLANGDLYFHRLIQPHMDEHLEESECIVPDCNMNGIDDLTDISGAMSLDLNVNSIPDECEDCDGNDVLDSLDIMLGAPDVNGNGIPDVCEPDCNLNGVPDDSDIAFGVSTDLYGNDIPDECEADCNTNDISDFTEIQSDMTLDKNRNTILDACENCDDDGQTDLEELSGAHDMWVASGEDGSILRRFHSKVGVLMNPSTGVSISRGQDVLVVGTGPAARVLVSSLDDARIMEFDIEGVYQQDLVSGGLLGAPAGMVMTADGDLLVANITGHNVLAYDGTTGAAQGPRVVSGAGGLSGPHGMTLGPSGNLYVTSSTNEVLEFNATSGAFERVLVAGTNNGGLDQPRGLAFKPDGNLLVASFGTESVLEFDGLTGRPRGKWAQVGTATAITQDNPWGIRVGPNGHVYVTRTGDLAPAPQPPVGASHLTDARMFEYDVCSGNFRKTHIGGQDHGLNYATGFAFIDGFDIDCNQNQLQDDCDIASGYSLDDNMNSIPDECEIDCNNNSIFDQRDLWPRGSSMDCNCNFIPDECDIGNGSSDCNANSVPDECEVNFDCNDNGTQDLCEVFNGTAEDCDANGVLDECELVGSDVILAADFESGLPSGWTATGMFSVTSACSVEPPCEGASWAYAGDTGSCEYDNANAGGLTMPPIDIPLGTTTLEFCHNRDTETDFDFTDITVNGGRIYRESGSTGGWVTEIIDLSHYEGQTITVVFSLFSDGGLNALGWQIDDVKVRSVGNRESDSDNDGVPDPCDACPGFDDTIDDNDNGIPDACEGTCKIHDNCADTNEDDIRDDNCIWWSCTAGVCAGTDIVFADMGGQFGACAPDGTADGNDRFHALNCFANIDPDGISAYSCENNPPAAFNVDAGGQFGSCAPDGVCDGNDAFAALNAFGNATSCACPLDGGPMPTTPQVPFVVERASITLTPSTTNVRPGGFIDIRASLDTGLKDLRGYQLHLASTGGTRGTLALVDISIDDSTALGATGPSWSAFNVKTGQMVAGRDNAGVPTSAQAYMATFTYQASANAAGTFAVTLLRDPRDQAQRTFLFPTPSTGIIPVERTAPVIVSIEK